MNIGGLDPVDKDYLDSIKNLVTIIEPRVLSDHLCFQKHGQRSHYDLLPFPLNQKHLDNCVQRLEQMQTHLDHKVYIENLCHYIEYQNSDISEADFIVELCQKLETKILLDLNNIHLNYLNLDIDYKPYLKIAHELIGQIHIAGGEKSADLWIDNHGTEPLPEVESMLNSFVKSKIPICYERDENIPSFQESLTYLQQLEKRIMA